MAALKNRLALKFPKVKFENGQAQLSPIRFHYDSPELSLPVRLGLINSNGTQDLIAARLAARKGHFMPPGLLDSQFKTLERPGASERPIIVSIDAPVGAIVDDIVNQLNLVPQ